MTVAEELNAAAAKVRELAAAAVPGPWHADGPWWWETKPITCSATITTDPERQMVAVLAPEYNQHPRAAGCAPWIALMHPGLAEPLAAWLESCARQAASMTHPEDWGVCDEPGSVRYAVDVARAILGNTAPAPGPPVYVGEGR
ncbi:hypothetical protein [Sphaerisporangium sp. TRM90804]|uniref:hypothetical protein n=1 Tax=Sphaerisporangium sp. TRM90804 TaxID=3031113 RepID=UPI00244A913A|nr:hypothetical protein [Sphaerisporangium sp. TRM90804]MDH2424825.1 hypothetical protein [Sphaerisporangium sp. TRM90804]